MRKTKKSGKSFFSIHFGAVVVKTNEKLFRKITSGCGGMKAKICCEMEMMAADLNLTKHIIYYQKRGKAKSFE